MVRRALAEAPGVSGAHDVRTRTMGDMIVVDAHIEVDAALTVEAGHDIAVEARKHDLRRHRVLNQTTHVDPWRGVRTSTMLERWQCRRAETDPWSVRIAPD